MTGYRVGAQPTQLATDQYVCQRCGITRQCNPKRKKPTRCADCRSIECSRGHLFPEDAKRNKRGHLVCIQCQREWNAAASAARHATPHHQEGTAA